MPRNDITIYLRAEARTALDELQQRWGGISRQEVIVRALLRAASSPD